MEVDNVTSGPAALPVLQVIRSSQLQNGLRHRDYQRYREYCARRLRRLRKGVDFKYAAKRGPFEFKQVTDELARRDQRFLLIPLMNAERAWGYAMQLKDENQREGEDPRKRLHLVRRLAKAAQWAGQLRELCAATADARTSLEAEAYAAWMEGNLLLEKDDWKDALVAFSTAKKIYEELSAIGTPESQDMMRERVEEIEPSLRYCTYNLSREGGPGASQEALKLLKSSTAGGVGSDLLQSKIRKVLEESRRGEAGAAASLVWKGVDIPVRSETVRIKLLEIRDQRAELVRLFAEADAAADSDLLADEGGLDKAYLEVLSVFDEASRAVREEQTRTAKQQGGAMLAQDLSSVLAYLKAAKVQAIMDRNAVFARSLEKRLDQGEAVSSAVTPNGPSPTKVEPQDVVNMYDRVLQNMQDLREIFGLEALESDKGTKDWAPGQPSDLTPASLRAYELSVRAQRTCHIAAWYARAHKWAEALALLEKSQDYVEQARAVATTNEDEATRARRAAQLDATESRVRAAKCLALAQAFQSRLGTQEGPALVDGGSEASVPQICALPPPIEPVPVNPVVFDLAFSQVYQAAAERTKEDVSKEGAAAAAAATSPSAASTGGEGQGSGWLSSARGWFGGGGKR